MSKTTPKGNPIRQPDPTRGPACFAPPLTPERLAAYQDLARAQETPASVSEAMLALVRLAERFAETPTSKLPGVPLQSEYTRSPFRGKAPPHIVPLEPEEIDRLWDAVPWDHDLRALGELFETLSALGQKALRDAAFHLLWFAKELALDREPMTLDRL